MYPKLGLNPQKIREFLLCRRGYDVDMLSDDELDEYVSSLLTNQAKQQATAYSTLGYRAFLNSRGRDGPVGKPNTRFLKNVVKHVDGFNAALARKEERESQEKLRDLRNKDGERLRRPEDNIGRARSNRMEDRRHRSRRDRSLSPSHRRDSDSEERSRRKRVKHGDSGDEDRKESRYRKSGYRRESPHNGSDDEERKARERNNGRRRRHRESDDETERKHRHRHRHRESREVRRSHRNDVTGRHSPSIRSRSDSRERYHHRKSTRDIRHSLKQSDSSPIRRSSYPHDRHRAKHEDFPDDSQRALKLPKAKLEESGSSLLEPDNSPIGPSPPINGPKFLLAKGRGNMNGGTLDAKFSESYDPRTDVDNHQSDSEDKYELDDWGLALRALRERQSYFLSHAMTERLADSDTKTTTPTWPTYSKGEREWDKGKVILDDGSVGVEVWGVKKPA